MDDDTLLSLLHNGLHFICTAGSLSLEHGVSSDWGWWSPASLIQCNWEYVEYAVVDSRQEVTLTRGGGGGWARENNYSLKKNSTLCHIGYREGSWEHHNKPSDSIKSGKFLDQLRDF